MQVDRTALQMAIGTRLRQIGLKPLSANNKPWKKATQALDAKASRTFAQKIEENIQV